ncbi:MAG TPA: sugar transferase [Desulfurivibrio alkaliphilus]|uniref:Sugar transferase n=1 Tax=Desulfurivibrio alkaliphilus TaxID=427923 RepID=A0A7C2XRJ6_9BACT|nr:sugar transferase [Desulfurivibrio alkaliphilus]
MYDPRSKELDRTVFLLDLICAVAAFLVAFWGRNLLLPAAGELNIYSHLFLLPLLLTLLIGFLSYFGAYKNPRYNNFLAYAWALFRSMALTIGVLLSLLFFLEIQYISRMVILFFAILAFLALLAIRLAAREYFKKSIRDGSGSLRVLIIGTGDRAREMARNLRNQAEWGIKVVGHLDPDPDRVGGEIDGAPVIGTVAEISECLKRNVVDEVIIAIPRSLLEDADPIAHACEEEGIRLRFMADIFNVQVARVSLTQIGHLPLLTMEPVAQDESKLFVKRLFDLVVTLLAMPLILPLMAVVALAVRLDSPGPAIFVQQRVGLRKHLFPMFKFRSMYLDAEEKLKEIEHLNEADGPIFKISNDPRITRVGRFIRKTSLDELPQLFNVLRGEMSLVGPRPMSIRDVDLFDRGIQRKRFSVKPGITCLWQISGRSDLTFEQWLALDLEYIEKWSFWLDIKILLKTIPAVLFSKGAM